MLVDYTELNGEAKVFLYPSSRKFYDNELDSLTSKIETFLNKEVSIKVAYKIVHKRFIIFFIEDNISLTTALINHFVELILQLEQDYKTDLLDKVNVCFKQGEYVQYQDMKRFRALIKKRSVSKKTIVFNNFIHTKYDFEHHFEVVVSESWLSHLFK